MVYPLQSYGAKQNVLRTGIKIESDFMGSGQEIERGDRVTVRYNLFLNRGDKVKSEEKYTFTIGTREVIAGLEYGVEGMRVGGRRRFRAGPHLAYRDRGVTNVIPPNAVLIFDVELIAVEPKT